MNKDHAQRMLNHLVTSMVNVDEVGVRRAGKVFHTKSHARMRNEKYYTPAWVARCLTRRVDLDCDIWEPAAGNGGLAIALAIEQRKAGHPFTKIWKSDIAPDIQTIERLDFLAVDVAPAPDIVTNPPFGTGGHLAVKFVRHALKLAEYHGGTVAMLLRDDFDSAKGRRDMFGEHPAFDRKIVITDRIRWTNLPQNPKKGPSGSHAWFVWDWSRDVRLEPIVQYERADEDPLAAAVAGSI